MTLVNHMRGQDKFHRGMDIEVRNYHILVGRPTASSHEYKGDILAELLHQRQMLGLASHIDDTVKARIADYRHIVAITFLG